MAERLTNHTGDYCRCGKPVLPGTYCSARCRGDLPETAGPRCGLCRCPMRLGTEGVCDDCRRANPVAAMAAGRAKLFPPDDAFWKATAPALCAAFAGVTRGIQADENKRVGQALAANPPEWAYSAGWQYAVMAAVEWCNTRPEIVDALFAAPDMAALNEYHRLRLVGLLPVQAIERSRDLLAGDGTTRRLHRVMCEAYERGRGAPGGGR